MTAAAPPVSVVIPAWNRAPSIAAAITSVLRQTWTDFELIVVDDGSCDGTLAAAARRARPAAPAGREPRNLGAAGARNLGAAEARGAWIAFQDSDDEWLPREAREADGPPARRPGAAPYVGGYCGLLSLGWIDDVPDARLAVRYLPGPAATPAEGDILTPLLTDNMISTQTLVVRRDRFHALGGFDPDTTPIEDWDFAIRLAEAGPIAFVDEPLVHQRFSAELDHPRHRRQARRAHPPGRAQPRRLRPAPGAAGAAVSLHRQQLLLGTPRPGAARRWLGRALRADPSPRSLAHALRMALRWLGRGHGAALRRGRSACPFSSASK